VCNDTLSDKSDDTETSASNLGTKAKGYDQSFQVDSDLSDAFKEGIVFNGFYSEEALEQFFDCLSE
jgi:hypothetical protein